VFFQLSDEETEAQRGYYITAHVVSGSQRQKSNSVIAKKKACSVFEGLIVPNPKRQFTRKATRG
jgi:hypothetical protein